MNVTNTAAASLSDEQRTTIRHAAEKLRTVWANHTGDKESRELCHKLEAILATPSTQAEADFKNFHRLLCERFDYAHDERDWKRDQLSLIEHIASRAAIAAGGAQEPARVDTGPNLEGLREKLLAPRSIERTSDGWLYHPDYPTCDEGTRADKFLDKYVNSRENSMAIEGTSFTVSGTSDYPICDCCGKTNLTRAVVVRNEFGEEFNIGCICASKVLRQRYQGKKHRLSNAAIIAIGKAARASKEWQDRNGYGASSFQLVAA